ncbi:ribonuclease H-like domain-containing protein [Tanacetum coccineum]
MVSYPLRGTLIRRTTTITFYLEYTKPANDIFLSQHSYDDKHHSHELQSENAIRTRFGGNANSKKMQKAVLKQQFKAFTISSLEGLEKGYDRFQQLLSQLEAHGAEVSTEDANHNKSSTNKVKFGHTGAYSTYTPSTSSNNIPEREVLAGFADEVIYSFFVKQSKDLDLLHEDLEQIDDLDIEEMNINWQIAMIAIRMKKFYKKTGRRVRIDGNKPVGFDKKKLECFKCHNTGHFARECTSKGTNDGKKRDSFYQDQGAGKKEQNQNCLLTMDDGVVNWGEHTVEEVETNHALMAINSNNEVSLFNSGMSSNSKVGSGYGIKSNNEVLSYEEEMNCTVFNCTKEDFIEKPLYNRFSKTDNLKGVPHPLTGDYTPKPQQEIDESLSNVNIVRPKQPVPTSNSNSFSLVRPQGNWGTAVKTSAGYNWRNTRPNSNCNSGSNFVRTDHPLKNMEDRGIFDSGCSGHMTGNKDHLDDFEECKGGSVTFGGSKGYITGKGRIRVGNLEFDSVSFVKELGHFNLFSISQICDKQHKVLFTETECLVVSPDFKMPDEHQILLKVPRQHNMYSFDMKTPAPTKDYACLIAKATSDESKLWHRRYALTHNPTIHDSLVKQFWQTATATTLADGTLELKATIDTLEYTITEASVQSKLQLADASGISMLPNNEIFEGMGNMGYPTDGFFTFWKSHFTPPMEIFSPSYFTLYES